MCLHLSHLEMGQLFGSWPFYSISQYFSFVKVPSAEISAFTSLEVGSGTLPLDESYVRTIT